LAVIQLKSLADSTDSEEYHLQLHPPTQCKFGEVKPWNHLL